jgi:glutamate dehydrogenase
LWAKIESLDNKMAATAQYAAMDEISRLLRHMTYWLLANDKNRLNIEASVKRYSPKVAELSRELSAVLGAGEAAQFGGRRKLLVEQGAPEPLANRLAALQALHAGLDVVDVATNARVPVLFAARIYYELGERLSLSWLQQQIDSLGVDGQWQSVARETLRDNLYALQRQLAIAAVNQPGGTPIGRLDKWIAKRAPQIDYLKRVLIDMRTSTNPDFATLSVALQSVRRISTE